MQQRGFTLIELVSVIVLLGVLAVTVSPRYTDMTREAKIAVLEGVGASIKSAADMTYQKAAIMGVNNDERGKVLIDGHLVELKWGYPEAYAEEGSNDPNWGLVELLIVDEDLEICYKDGKCSRTKGNGLDDDFVRIGFDAKHEGEDGCYVRYYEPNHGDDNYTHGNERRYEITYVIKDC